MHAMQSDSHRRSAAHSDLFGNKSPKKLSNVIVRIHVNGATPLSVAAARVCAGTTQDEDCVQMP